MKTIELTIDELFKPFTEIQLNGTIVDLHNDYECVEIACNLQNKSLMFVFGENNYFRKKVWLSFSGVEMINSTFLLDNILFPKTLDNFYKGRFLNAQNELKEQNPEGKNCYYLDFYEGQSCEFLAEKINFSIEI